MAGVVAAIAALQAQPSREPVSRPLPLPVKTPFLHPPFFDLAQLPGLTLSGFQLLERRAQVLPRLKRLGYTHTTEDGAWCDAGENVVVYLQDDIRTLRGRRLAYRGQPLAQVGRRTDGLRERLQPLMSVEQMSDGSYYGYGRCGTEQFRLFVLAPQGVITKIELQLRNPNS